MEKRMSRALALALLGMVASAVAWTGAISASAQELPGPGQVQVYAYVANIQSVDLAANTFTGDFVVGLKWTDESLHPQDTLRLLNASDASSMTLSSSGDPVKGPDGAYTWTQRAQGPFTTPFSLVTYPFQSQTLAVVFDAPGGNFVASAAPMGMSPTITLPGYVVGTGTLTVTAGAGADVFGAGDQAPVRSRIAMTVPLEAPVFAGVVKVLLPIVIVIVATALIFCVPPDHTDARLGLGITALLTLVALQLGTGLPNLTYLSMLDVIFMAAFAFVVAAMCLVIWNMWTVRSGGEEAVVRRDRISLLVLPGAYLLANVAILFYFLS